MKTARRRKLAAAIDEKPMINALASFAEEAERVEKARQDSVAEIEQTRVAANDRYPRAVDMEKDLKDPTSGYGLSPAPPWSRCPASDTLSQA